jgi:hypothetical protein
VALVQVDQEPEDTGTLTSGGASQGPFQYGGIGVKTTCAMRHDQGRVQ